MKRPAQAVAWLGSSLCLLLGSCGPGGAGGKTPVRVFAAASLSEAFRALEREFEAAHVDADIELNFAGSQLLAAQLLEGANAQLFASANAAQLERVAAARPVLARQTFAANTLVLVVREGGPVHDLDGLRAPGVRVVLAGEAVPAGRYAREALDALGLRAAVEANVVSNEASVRGVIAKLALGEADAGLAYATDVSEGQALTVFPLPASLDGPRVHYELALLASEARGGGDAKASLHAREFADYVSSAAGQQILREHGFSSPLVNER